MKRVIVLLVAALFAGKAVAAPIGNATSVTPQASIETRSGIIPLSSGGLVEQNNRVITGPSGQTSLRFLDASLLEIGSNAAVTLDEFVYDGARASKVALTMTRGVFRWVSGASPKPAYDLKTPLASIGIRGTELGIETNDRRTTIRLRAGSIEACSRISDACATLNRQGQGVHIDADGWLETFEDRVQQPPLIMQRAGLPPTAGPRALRAKAASQQARAPQKARRLARARQEAARASKRHTRGGQPGDSGWIKPH